MPCARAARTKARKSASVPRSGCTASCPPSSDPMAQGEPGSPGCGSSVLLRPLRLRRPIGWIGGRYSTSKPIAATAGSRFVAVRKVPLLIVPSLSRRAPSDRGKNSYQAPTPARSRSTRSSFCGPMLMSEVSGRVAKKSAIDGSRTISRAGRVAHIGVAQRGGRALESAALGDRTRLLGHGAVEQAGTRARA